MINRTQDKNDGDMARTVRKAIGELFVRIFEENTGGVTDAEFLVQGTLYPDIIESGGSDGTAAVIKSHHNVGGLPEDMTLELTEPLRDLFKDEVRKVGHELGLPDEIVWRQPFPGPGLGVRIIGEVTREKVAILQEADAIVREEIANAVMYLCSDLSGNMTGSQIIVDGGRSGSGGVGPRGR